MLMKSMAMPPRKRLRNVVAGKGRWRACWDRTGIWVEAEDVSA